VATETAVDADTNHNGVVSFLEAHNYAVANDSASEHPMWSDPGNLGDQLSLVTDCGDGTCDGTTESACTCPGDCATRVVRGRVLDLLGRDRQRLRRRDGLRRLRLLEGLGLLQAVREVCTTNAQCCSRRCQGKWKEDLQVDARSPGPAPGRAPDEFGSPEMLLRPAARLPAAERAARRAGRRTNTTSPTDPEHAAAAASGCSRSRRG